MKTFEVVLTSRPNGMHIFENKGRLKAGVKTSHLWFATRWDVPDNIYDSWDTELIIWRSDTDTSDGTDTDIELSHSVTGLAITPEKGKKRMTISSPGSETSNSRQHVTKKMKADAAHLSLVPSSVLQPVLSPPPEVVAITEDDVIFGGCIAPGQPDAPPVHNPWSARYSLPSLDLDLVR